MMPYGFCYPGYPSYSNAPTYPLPGGLAPGTAYLFPGAHQTFAIINNFDENAETNDPTFVSFKVPTCIPIEQFLTSVGAGPGWKVTQLMERGGGRWEKSPITYTKGTPEAAKTLKDAGWELAGGSHNDDLRIWLWVRAG